MASVKKFKGSAVVSVLRHNKRTIAKPSNSDIDPMRSCQNYSLINRGITDYEYFKHRKSQLYCYKRKDVKVLAGWVVTAPKDLAVGDYEAFFQVTHAFLCERYGEENCVQSVVHNDESGQPHLHWMFIPACEDKKHGGEKICAANVINKRDLTNFHPDFQAYLKMRGINANVNSGITAAQGGNRRVADMKREREKTLERIINETVREKHDSQIMRAQEQTERRKEEIKQERKRETARFATDAAREIGREVVRGRF